MATKNQLWTGYCCFLVNLFFLFICQRYFLTFSIFFSNGKSRAGVYCAANYAMEQVVQHGEVDIFNAVRTVRRHRPQLIENETEYKYCYDLLFHYVTHYLNKDKVMA